MPEASKVCVYWGPAISGSRRVILRKIQQSGSAPYKALEGAVFTVYRGNSVVKVGEEELKELSSQSNGVFWVGTLDYGTYYLHETAPNDKWFTLTVAADTSAGSGDGISMTGAQDADPRA